MLKTLLFQIFQKRGFSYFFENFGKRGVFDFFSKNLEKRGFSNFFRIIYIIYIYATEFSMQQNYER